MADLIIAVHRSDVERYGVAEAVVLQQIRHYIGDPKRSDDGWFTATSTYLSELTGLTVKQVRRSVSSLLSAGALEKAQLSAHRGDQTCSYRPIEPTDSAVAHMGNPGDAQEGNSSDAQEGNSTSLIDHEEVVPPYPPEGGEGSGQLFDENAGKPKNRRARQRPAVISEPMVKALADRIWKSWPKKSGRDTFDRALLRILDEGGAITEVDQWVANYLETHRAYREIWNRKPPEMNLGTFLNGKARDFEDGPVNPDRWPAPTGEDWERWRGEQRFYAANGHQDAVSPWCGLAEVFE